LTKVLCESLRINYRYGHKMKKTNYKNNQQQQQQILWNDLYNMLYAHRFHIGCLTISFSALNYESCQYVVGQSD